MFMKKLSNLRQQTSADARLGMTMPVAAGASEINPTLNENKQETPKTLRDSQRGG